jgi:hypothetical protein
MPRTAPTLRHVRKARRIRARLQWTEHEGAKPQRMSWKVFARLMRELQEAERNAVSAAQEALGSLAARLPR